MLCKKKFFYYWAKVVDLGPGSPPYNISAELEDCTIFVKWQPPLIPNGQITVTVIIHWNNSWLTLQFIQQEYTVYYTFGNVRKDLRHWTFIRTNQTMVRVLDAIVGETYYFRILPYNKYGPGIASAVFTLKTETEGERTMHIVQQAVSKFSWRTVQL